MSSNTDVLPSTHLVQTTVKVQTVRSPCPERRTIVDESGIKQCQGPSRHRGFKTRDPSLLDSSMRLARLKLSDSHMKPHPTMSPRSIRMGGESVPSGLPLQTLATHLEDVSSRPQLYVGGSALPKGSLNRHPALKSTPRLQTPGLGPLSPRLGNAYPHPKSDSNSVNTLDDKPPCLDDGLNPHVEASLKVTLAGIAVVVALNVECLDVKQDICGALVVLRPIFIQLSFGAAITACVIPLIQHNRRLSHCLVILWRVLCGLSLCCLIIQVTLFAWTAGNPVTRVVTTLIAISCSLPVLCLIILKRNPKPPVRVRIKGRQESAKRCRRNLEPRDVEAGG